MKMPIEVGREADVLWDEVGSPQTATPLWERYLKILAACDDLVMMHSPADAVVSKCRVLDRLRRGDLDELEDRGLGNTERKSCEVASRCYLPACPKRCVLELIQRCTASV